MNLNHTFAVGKGRQTASGNGRANQEYNDGLAPWTRVVATPLFGWKPTHRRAPNEGENKKKKSHLVQGELFPDQLADGSLKRPQPVALLEA